MTLNTRGLEIILVYVYMPPKKPNGKKKPNAKKKIVLRRPKPLTAKQKADRQKERERIRRINRRYGIYYDK